MNQELWDLVIPQIPQCRLLSVDMSGALDDAQELHIIQALSDCSAPLLTSLNIAAREIASTSFDDQSPIFAGGTPLLTHLALHGKAPTWFLPSLQSVTTLALDLPISSNISAELSTKLQEMPLLAHLRLNTVDRWQDPVALNLPNICTIYLDGIYWGGVMNVFLRMIQAPKLQELTINAQSLGDDVTAVEALVVLPPTRYPSLKRLRGMCAVDVRLSMLLSCAFPLATDIHITHFPGPSRFRSMIGESRFSQLRSVEISDTALDDELMRRLGLPHLLRIERLGLSPEHVAEGRRYASDLQLALAVTGFAKLTPFPLGNPENYSMSNNTMQCFTDTDVRSEEL